MSAPTLLTEEQFSSISNSKNQVFISSASIWEIRIKESLGKIEVPSDIVNLIKEEGFDFLSVNEKHADYVSRLPKHHKDPFDRIIVSQAILEGLTIISSDKNIEKYLD